MSQSSDPGQLPPTLCSQNPHIPPGIYSQDVVHPQYKSPLDYMSRHKGIQWWLENRLSLFQPLHWLQKAELRRIVRWLAEGNVIEAERGIVNLIDLEVWK